MNPNNLKYLRCTFGNSVVGPKNIIITNTKCAYYGPSANYEFEYIKNNLFNNDSYSYHAIRYIKNEIQPIIGITNYNNF